MDRHKKQRKATFALTVNEAVIFDEAVKRAGVSRQYLLEISVELTAELVELGLLALRPFAPIKLREGQQFEVRLAEDAYRRLKLQAEQQKCHIGHMARLYVLMSIRACGFYQGPQGPIPREEFERLLRLSASTPDQSQPIRRLWLKRLIASIVGVWRAKR
ncbi:MAG: hypothetical protein P4L74_01220 [Candidatus Doudnabacteria bacterium]|nr:hypothetical protein [Candidatus Doudnabacteria bacterium]